MIRTLEIQFPVDFDERYGEYRAKILGAKKPTSPNLSTDFDITKKAQTKALKDTLAQGENNERIKREIIEELGNKERLQDSNNFSKIDTKLTLDPLNGVLRYGNTTHSFHRGSRGEERRLILFKKLWEEKRVIKNGVVKAKGNVLPPETIAVQIGMTDSVRDFQTNTRVRNQLFSIIKGINRILKNKDIPALIERQNGIQLIITEK